MLKREKVFQYFSKKDTNKVEETKSDIFEKENIVEMLKEASSLEGNIESVQSHVQTLSNEVMDVAYGINEISKEASDAAQLTENINQSSGEMGRAIENIAVKATDAALVSTKIAEKAEQMMESSVDANAKAISIYQETKEQLEKAIKDAKQVNDIRNLSEEIRVIADKTNLISLNASIEAARVGEAGRSFVVVASTIRELADNSKKTVEKIQKVADSVVEVVDFLSSSSEKLLNFVSEQVIKDYESMVDTAKQYKEDSVVYNDIATELGATSEEMSSSVQEIVAIIQTIAALNRSLANRIEDTAVTVANSSLHAMDVLGDMEQVVNSSQALVGKIKDQNDTQE